MDQAIDKLIDCLEIIAREPAFNLNKKTRTDIDTLVANLRPSHNASESAIRSWLMTAGELIKLFIPYEDKVEKSIELLGKTQAAFDAVGIILDNARHKIVARLISEFCWGEKIVPVIEENTPLIKLELSDSSVKHAPSSVQSQNT